MDYILRILPNMFAGLGVSAQIFLITIVLSLPIGILLALVRISKVAVFRKLAEIYIYVMRGTPLHAADHVHLLRAAAHAECADQ